MGTRVIEEEKKGKHGTSTQQKTDTHANHRPADDRRANPHNQQPKQPVEDIYNVDRGGIFHHNAGKGEVTRNNVMAALSDMKVTPEVKRAVKDSIRADAILSVSEATKIIDKAVKKSDLQKFGSAPTLPPAAQLPGTENNLTPIAALNQVLPDPTKGRYGLNNLNVTLNSGDTGQGSGLLNISGRHDNFLNAREATQLIEQLRHQTMLPKERKEIEKQIGDKGIDIDHTLKSVVNQLRDNPQAPIKPTALEQDPLSTIKLR